MGGPDLIFLPGYMTLMGAAKAQRVPEDDRIRGGAAPPGQDRGEASPHPEHARNF